MLVEMMTGKIHCARVTEANLNYVGSITIDSNLIDAAFLQEIRGSFANLLDTEKV